MKYDISEKYKVNDEIYDELFLSDGTPRKITQILLNRLKEMGDDEAERRHKRLNYTQYYQALIKANNDNNNKGLDSIPFFIGAEEWHKLERGISQRAKLYDLIVRDIYGEQRLIKDKIVPPAFVFANPDFCRCYGPEKHQMIVS